MVSFCGWAWLRRGCQATTSQTELHWTAPVIFRNRRLLTSLPFDLAVRLFAGITLAVGGCTVEAAFA
jgi:hypothetical protein